MSKPEGLKQNYGAVALYSGGVDSTAAPLLVRERLQCPILLLMIDLGESQNGIDRAAQRAEVLGMDFKLIDGKEAFAADYLSEAIRMNGSYWGYPLITPLSRAFIMETAARLLPNDRPSYVIHGCTAKQNTRYRIEKACSLYPNMVAVGPFVTHPRSRSEKIRFLETHRISSGEGAEFAEDQNIWGRAIEGDSLNDLGDIEAKKVFTLTRPLSETPDQPQTFSLDFVDGIPVAMDEQEMPLHQIIMECSRLGAAYGVGRIIAFEDTIPEIGYKEMGIYESPASEIIYTLHRFIESAVLTHTERRIKRDMDQDWSEIVYRGGWLDANRRELSELAKTSQSKVQGRIFGRVFKGHVMVGFSDIPGNRLMRQADSLGAY